MMSLPKVRSLQRVALILTTAITALDVLYAVPVNGRYRSLDRDGYSEAHREVVRVAGSTAPVIAVPLLVTDSLLLWRMRGERGFGWILTSLVCLLANAAITFSVNVPINDEFTKSPDGPSPENWKDLRDRWLIAHNVRTVAQVVGLFMLLAGAMKSDENTTGRN